MSSAGEEPQEEPSTSGAAPPQRGGAKLFLGGLSWNTTEENLRDHFGRYGDIVEAVVMRDRQTGRPRGFGFVTFTSPDAADKVVEEIHVIDGRQIDAKKSVPQELKPKARKVFVGGLAPEVTEEEFRAYFDRFGEVVEAQIMQDHMSGRSRGFGFITFERDESAEAVFQAGAMHDLGGKKVEVKPATPKGTGAQRPGGPVAGPPGVGGAYAGIGGRGGYPFPRSGAGGFVQPGGPAGGMRPYGAAVGSPPVGPGYAYGMYGYSPGVVPPGAAAGYGLSYPLQGPYMPGMVVPPMGGYQAYAYPSPSGFPQPGMLPLAPQHHQPPGGRGSGGTQQQYGSQQAPTPLPVSSGSSGGARGGLRGGSSTGGSGSAGSPYSPTVRPPELQRQPSLGKGSSTSARSKVDSASSLDLHSQAAAAQHHFKGLNLE